VDMWAVALSKVAARISADLAQAVAGTSVSVLPREGKELWVWAMEASLPVELRRRKVAADGVQCWASIFVGRTLNAITQAAVFLHHRRHRHRHLGLAK